MKLFKKELVKLLRKELAIPAVCKMKNVIIS